MKVGIDFDGTVVTDEYPKVGRDVGAVPVLLDLIGAGHQLILYTMRSGKELDEAVEWFSVNNIPLWGVNNNNEQKEWTSSPKVCCDLYIDAAGIGTPLVYARKERPYVNWKIVEGMLIEKGYLL